MANALLTIQMITRQAIRLYRNSNAFIQQLDHQYDDSYAKTGAKIGTTLRIRLPNDYTVRTGQAAQVQDTNEINTSLVLATQKGVDISFSSQDRSLSLDDFSTRVLAPAVNKLAGSMALDVMSGSENFGVSNLVGNITGGVISSPTAQTVLNTGARLSNQSAQEGSRKIVLSPTSNANIVFALAGFFNPQQSISKQYMTGKMQEALGFDFMQDQTVIAHTTGTLAQGSATVNGAGQTGSTLIVNALPGSLNAGDIITLAGVYMVNHVTNQSTGQLMQFGVTQNAAAGATSISIYPAIIPAAADGSPVQYQTVTVSPANGAAVNLAGGLGPSVTYTKNLAFVKEAITLATADLELPRGVHEAYREEFDGISMRMITAYNIATDQFITRLDILYGYTYIRPEWCVVIPDVLPVG